MKNSIYRVIKDNSLTLIGLCNGGLGEFAISELESKLDELLSNKGLSLDSDKFRSEIDYALNSRSLESLIDRTYEAVISSIRRA